MNKQKYEIPRIETNAFAQFENVYTACDKNPSADNCIWGADIQENGGGTDPSHYSHHSQLSGVSS